MVNDSKSMQSSSTSADTEEQIFGEAANVELLLRKLSRIDPRRENLSENEEIQVCLHDDTAASIANITVEDSVHMTDIEKPAITYRISILTLRPKIVKLIEEYAEKKERLEGLRNKILHANQTYNELMAN
ncbi:hypothetical protein EV182_008192, partial [Spiromyces aspiralis]